MISELQKRRVAFSKRYPTLFKKAGELAILTSSDLFLGVRSSTGRTFYCNYQKGKLINSNIARRKGHVNSSTGPKEREEGLVKQECDACMISELQKRRVAFSKRYPTLFKKAGELAMLTSSDLFLRVRSSTGRTFYCNYQKGKLIDSNIARRKGKVNSSTGPREWEEGLVKQECDACMAKEDLRSVIANYEASFAYAHERLGNWENNPSSVKAGDSGVKVDCETEERTDEGIDSILKRFDHGDSESFWTSLLNLTAGSASGPTSSGLDDCEFNLDDLLNFSEDCIGHGDHPENSAISRTADPTSSGLDDGEFNPDDFLSLSEDYIGDGDRLENSAFGGGYNPDDFAGLGDLDIPLDIGYF